MFDISALFEQELKARNEDLRRKAALSMLPKLRPSPRVTMAEFLDSLQQHREVWSAVLEMSAVEFASLIAGGPRADATKTAPEQTKRTRISDAQKNSLKGTIVSELGNRRDGLNRTDIAGQIGDDVLVTIGVKRDELANKLRQPLGELVADNKIHTIGEKAVDALSRGAEELATPYELTISSFTVCGYHWTGKTVHRRANLFRPLTTPPKAHKRHTLPFDLCYAVAARASTITLS